MNQPPLVLSLSQIQSGNGLLILNGQNQHENGHMNRLTPLSLPPLSSGSAEGHPHNAMMHSNRSDTMESSASSNSPLESSAGGMGTASPVSSAVRSLTSLSDFSSLDMTSGNPNHFDPYSGLQPVTDSLLSGTANSDHELGNKHDVKSENRNNNNNNNNSGPLLDFKSAFSVLDDKSGNLR